MAKVYDYETTFDTANRTMTFNIHPRLQITVNFAEFELIIIKDGKVKDRVSYKGEHFSLRDMELILQQACEASEKL